MPSQTLIYNELLLSITFAGRVGFEKLTELDYRGTTYYTIRNLSLYECQGWCREEPDCAAASFRFVVFSGWHSRKWQTITQNKATSHRDEVYSSTHLFFFFVRSFVVNPLAPIQETVCLLQNETTGASPTVSPQKSVSTYYMIKLNIRSGNNRLNWLEFKRRRLTVTRFCQNGHWLGKSSIFRLRGDERRGRFLTNFVPTVKSRLA